MQDHYILFIELFYFKVSKEGRPTLVYGWCKICEDDETLHTSVRVKVSTSSTQRIGWSAELHISVYSGKVVCTTCHERLVLSVLLLEAITVTNEYHLENICHVLQLKLRVD